jgi:hypothetical protein
MELLTQGVVYEVHKLDDSAFPRHLHAQEVSEERNQYQRGEKVQQQESRASSGEERRRVA